MKHKKISAKALIHYDESLKDKTKYKFYILQRYGIDLYWESKQENNLEEQFNKDIDMNEIDEEIEILEKQLRENNTVYKTLTELNKDKDIVIDCMMNYKPVPPDVDKRMLQAKAELEAAGLWVNYSSFY
jgi:hypothetical protein